ncbi:hypothetical protein [Saccharopolyspora hattusasensis]|uniref:hypothetical protein n=1 Tax=Saccharopolyspora hattusasensis TaxID=1128679 RepID=UPI003D97FA91
MHVQLGEGRGVRVADGAGLQGCGIPGFGGTGLAVLEVCDVGAAAPAVIFEAVGGLAVGERQNDRLSRYLRARVPVRADPWRRPPGTAARWSRPLFVLVVTDVMVRAPVRSAVDPLLVRFSRRRMRAKADERIARAAFAPAVVRGPSRSGESRPDRDVRGASPTVYDQIVDRAAGRRSSSET